MKLLSSSLASSLAFTLLISVNACSPAKQQKAQKTIPSGAESYPLSNVQLKNCHFKYPTVQYTFKSTIEPNTVICDEGLPKKVELLSPAPLPSGIQFSTQVLALVGTANERVVQAPYTFYLENEAGYTTIQVQITVR